jgi:hypothetical protein
VSRRSTGGGAEGTLCSTPFNQRALAAHTSGSTRGIVSTNFPSRYAADFSIRPSRSPCGFVPSAAHMSASPTRSAALNTTTMAATTRGQIRRLGSVRAEVAITDSRRKFEKHRKYAAHCRKFPKAYVRAQRGQANA